MHESEMMVDVRCDTIQELCNRSMRLITVRLHEGLPVDGVIPVTGPEVPAWSERESPGTAQVPRQRRTTVTRGSSTSHRDQIGIDEMAKYLQGRPGVRRRPPNCQLLGDFGVLGNHTIGDRRITVDRLFNHRHNIGFAWVQASGTIAPASFSVRL